MTCTFLCAIFLTEAQTGRASIDSLYDREKYFDASIACERVLFGGADPADLFYAVVTKTQCLKQQQLFDQAVTFLNAWQSYPFPDSGQIRIGYEQVLCNYLGGHFENTVSLADRWPYLHGGQPAPSLLNILKILSLNEEQQWQTAWEAYREFIAGKRLPAAPPDLYAQQPKLKSVEKAQWLSTFIPGAGQFYAGRPGEAIFSILVQAAGIWFGVLSFEQHYYISAWLVGAALFGSFHMGGVRRSEVLVRQYNQKRITAFNEKVRTQLLELGP